MALSDQIKALKDKKAQLVAEGRQLLDRMEAENRTAMTAEEEANWTRCHTDERNLATQIERLVSQAEAESREAEQNERIAALAAPRPTIAGQQDAGADPPTDPGSRSADGEAYRTAFMEYVRNGMANITPEQRALVQSRALSTGVDAAGGFLVPEGFQARIVEALKQFGGMRQTRVEVITTSTGQDLPIPTDNDTTNKGALLSEGAAVTEQDLTFGQVTLHAYTYTSKEVKVSLQLLQDNAFDLESYISRKLGERLGRITNDDYTTGNGASRPYGIMPQATVGKTGASATSVTMDEVYDLIHSVDPAYRLAAQFMFNDTTLKILKKLKDGQGRYLWQSGIAVRQPDTIDQHDYVVNQSVADMASNALSMAFGDFSLYKIRDVRGFTLLRLNERHAENLQVAFLAFLRTDGVLVDAGTGPVKTFKNAA